MDGSTLQKEDIDVIPLQEVEFDDKIIEEKSAKSKSSLIDIKKIAPLLKTKPDTAFFWSGDTNGFGGKKRAKEIALQKGGKALELLIEENQIDMPTWDMDNPLVIETWENVSNEYAKQVSGVVRAVIGKTLRKNNIWENVELPQLMDNLNVTKIISIDPETATETVVFERR